jgi:hypothetical protein
MTCKYSLLTQLHFVSIIVPLVHKEILTSHVTGSGLVDWTSTSCREVATIWRPSCQYDFVVVVSSSAFQR